MTNPGSRHTPICLDDDDDDDNDVVPSRPAAPIGLSIQERRLLNQQREARQAKRMRGEEVVSSNDQRPAQRPRLAASASAQQSVAPTQTDTGSPLSPIQPLQRFWRGTIRRSWNRYVGTGMQFSQMLLPTTSSSASGLQHALLINFSPEPTWLHSQFPSGVPVTLIHSFAQEARTERLRSPSFPGWDVILPARSRPGEKYGTQHVKMLALFYADRLRLCILTGNFLPLDWEHIENVAYIQDFHRLQENSKSLPTTCDAYAQLHMMLTSMGLTPTRDRALAELSRYDLSTLGSDSGARLVVSMPGPGGKSVEAWANVEKLGLGRLKRVVDDLQVKAVRGGLELSAQGSSLGGDSNIRWLSQLHIIASGLSRGLVPVPGGKWKAPPALTSALQRPAPSTYASASSTSSFPPSGCPPVRVLFPSSAQVASNLAGSQVGGAFFAKQKYIDTGGYQRLLHQPVSERGKLLMHAKVILALPKGAEFKSGAMTGKGRRLDEPEHKHEKEKGKEKEKANEDKPCGWLYVGSHNLTRSAWGNLSGTTSEPKLTLCYNFELGIVFPIRDVDLQPGATSLARDALVFVNPPPCYGANDSLWQQESQDAA